MGDTRTQIQGCLLGTAVGDALGLAAEGLSPRRQQRLYPGMPRYGLLGGRGFGSDDTDHACLTAQALIAAGGDPALFAESLGRGLRRWFVTAPFGIGFATLKSGLKLCVGVRPDRSGVWSAGNGPAMRTPIIGALYGGNPERLREFVRLATRVTHTDPKAEIGALAIAFAAHWAATHAAVVPAEFAAACNQLLQGKAPVAEGTDVDALEFMSRLRQVVASVEKGESTPEFARAQGWRTGVSGYMYHTVPAALHAWLRHPHDFRGAMTDIIACGGDADTIAAITGGIVGAGVGVEGIPEEWRCDFRDWPHTGAWLTALGAQLAESAAAGVPARPLDVTLPALWLRALVLDSYILLVALRRILPPY